jgi:BON domain
MDRSDRSPNTPAQGEVVDASPWPKAQREAWPWLNYPSAWVDPYFAHLYRNAQSIAAANEPAALGRWPSRALRRLRQGRGGGSTTATDDLLAKAVMAALRGRRDVDISDIKVVARDATVTLEGTVSDRYEKRRAKEVARSTAGVRRVRDKLTLRDGDPNDADFLYAF